MASQIAKVNKDLTTAADMRKTTQMLMQPNANWEEYLAPAPLSIAIMGELVFISSGTDFSINKNPPKDGFKHIKYPDSFRACLMQVCNSGWQAFNLAHKNMDQIRIHTASVPDHMKAAVKFLFQGDDEVIQNFLPNQLENIRTIADECVGLAGGVEEKYQDVICLIQELLEACINAKLVYGDELEKVKNKIEANKMREKTAKELNERYEKAMEAMEKQVEEAQEEFKTSMNSLPTGMELVAMEMAESLSQTVATMGSAVATMATEGTSNILSGMAGPAGLAAMAGPGGIAAMAGMALVGGLAGNLSGPQPKTKKVESVSDIAIYSKSPSILNQAKAILSYMNKNEINWKALYHQKNEKTEFIKQQFKKISTDLAKAQKSIAKDKALSLCRSGIVICEQLAKYSPDKKWDKKTTEKMITDVKKLHQDALQFDSSSKMKCGAPAIAPTPPMLSKTEVNAGPKTEGNAGHQRASQAAADNARFRIEQSREQLKQSREEYNKAVDRMEKNKKELTEILVEMQNCKIEEIDFDTTIKMLVKGMDAMGRVKEQWEKMVRFFQMVANIVKTSLSKTMNHFAQGVEDAQKLSYNSRLFTKDLLYNQAFQASNIASLVHMISGTYCEVSNKHLMDRISSLGRLMTMDKDKPEFKQERQKLQDSCKEAQEGILELVQNNKKEFEKNTDTRLAQIEGGLKAVLPAADPEETKRIKEIVQASITEEDLDDYA
ncbi:hypothetical protein OJAV_G00187460 [Oryzias javanicus]|uniref:Uncharacterized protein n=1 Tax=Oryzias javanicus TaxID=123683 RepID=A0A3S2NU62_ORYJA|nr:hypothetical protein OJAV_G00187460 [Oryzias javanicus]